MKLLILKTISLILLCSISSEFYAQELIDRDVKTRQNIGENLHVKGSLQIGVDANSNHDFGFDTFVMTEDNLRMYFKDNSASASFPSNDWRFLFNDADNGGKNYFAVEDATGSKVPFKVEAGAATDLLYLKGNRVGINTNNPATLIHVVDGNTPTFRLEQSNAGGWSAYSWDVAANETNFFIRDLGNGKLSFRVQAKTPENTLTLRQSGTVGIGTWTPNKNASLHLSRDSQGLLINRMNAEKKTAFGDKLTEAEDGMMIYDTELKKIAVWNGTEWTNSTDNQSITLSENKLSISNNSSEVDLSQYLDNTDAQTLSLDGTGVSISGGNTVDLSQYLDNTDAQTLSLDGTGVTISGGNTVDLSQYLDNTDAQILSLDGTGVSISGGNTVDLSQYLDNTDAQTLSLDGTGVSISGGNTVDLSQYLDNTDAQTLSVNGTEVSISGGNTVNLYDIIPVKTYQNLSKVSLTKKVLNIGIEKGSGAAVDLSPLTEELEQRNRELEEELNTKTSDLQRQIDAQQAIINGLIERIEALESPMSTNSVVNSNEKAQLSQNIPNPFKNSTTIRCYIPEDSGEASIIFTDIASGKTLSNVKITDKGNVSIMVTDSQFISKTIAYTLIVDGRKIDTKKMIAQ
ncbi:MAG: hypothetical protein ACEPOV_07690 [Hyphomicrobiales bacterium]